MCTFYVPCEDCMCVEICIQANISRICGLTKAKQGYNQLPSHPHIVQTEAYNIAKGKILYMKSGRNQHCEATLEECVTLSSVKISLLKTFLYTTKEMKENWATFPPNIIIYFIWRLGFAILDRFRPLWSWSVVL